MAGGQAQVALALGFEKMSPGSQSSVWTDRTNPMDQTIMATMELRGLESKVPFAPQIFGNAGIEYLEKYGSPDSSSGSAESLDVIAAKSHNHRLSCIFC